jgi:hypothetical protein
MNDGLRQLSVGNVLFENERQTCASQESFTKLVTTLVGFWTPLDLLKCTSSANKDAIPDDWGPHFQQSLNLFASGP